MTECTPQRVEFAKAGRRQIVADLSGGTIASDGGLPLLRELDRASSLTRKLAACFDDDRCPHKVSHPLQQLLAQRIYAIACGYADGNDHLQLRDDPLFQLAAARPGKRLASPATICRFENSSLRPALIKAQGVFVQHFLDAHTSPPKQIVLDLDATDTTVHGNQEGRFFNGYYDSYCFLPLYITSGNFLLTAWLRHSGRDAAAGSLLALRPIVSAIRARWPDTRIVIRADSGFCRDWLLSWCEANGVDYIIGLARNDRLKHFSEQLIEQAQQDYAENLTKGRVIGDFAYRTLSSWERTRRVIGRMEHTERGDNPRYVVTSLRGNPRRLYEELYCARGDMENRIKEVQLQLFGGRTSCSKFMANQLRLTLAAAAYLLMNDLRRLGCAGTELERCCPETLRLKLLKIGCRVELSVRRMLLRLSSSSPYGELLLRIASRLRGGAEPAAP